MRRWFMLGVMMAGVAIALCGCGKNYGPAPLAVELTEFVDSINIQLNSIRTNDTSAEIRESAKSVLKELQSLVSELNKFSKRYSQINDQTRGLVLASEKDSVVKEILFAYKSLWHSTNITQDEIVKKHVDILVDNTNRNMENATHAAVVAFQELESETDNTTLVDKTQKELIQLRDGIVKIRQTFLRNYVEFYKSAHQFDFFESLR